MGKYSIRGSAEFDARIDADMARIDAAVQASPFAGHWKALVLLGGYGRGEGSPFIQRSGAGGRRSACPPGRKIRSQGPEDGLSAGAEGQRSEIELPFNDYDLIVVTDSVAPEIRAELKALEKQLTDALGLPVDLYPYLEKKLPRCEFSLLNYEMKYGHRVISGDKKILDRMPDYPLDALPLSEGTRLLLNRGKLLLDIKRRLAQPGSLTAEERECFLKFLFKTDLALGDCALLACGEYDISYTIKKGRIGQLDLPEGIACAYLDAVAFKERTDFQPLENVRLPERFAQTAARFERLFLWFEGLRLDRSFRSPEEYAAAFPTLGHEGNPLKNALHNLRTFRAKALPHLLTHPRLRLYAAVPLLLREPPLCETAARLLCAPSNRFESCCKTFYALQQRFS
jgi:hypothetical protein